METNLKENILVVNHMKKYFPTKKKGLFVKAIDDISFTVRKNEVVGLVGESGSGCSFPWRRYFHAGNEAIYGVEEKDANRLSGSWYIIESSEKYWRYSCYAIEGT